MTLNPFSLERKTILVTGASSGIGRAVAARASLLGGTLILTGRNEERLRETRESLAGEGHFSCPGDLRSEEFLDRLVGEAVTKAGPVSGFVHCAGIEKTQPFRSTSREDLQKIMDVNFLAFWGLCRRLFRKGRYRGGLSVVGIASVAGYSGTPGNAAYAASKGALISLIKTLAVEYAPKGIRVNCVCPGYVNTPMLEKLKKLYPSEEAFENSMERLHPLGLGTPEDVADAVAYLLSDAAKWVTGAVNMVDGGYSA